MRGFTGGIVLVAGVLVGAPVAVGACGQDYAVVVPDAGTGAGPIVDGATAPEDGEGVTPGPILDATYTAGTRLEPSFFVVGGTKVFVDWWDRTLRVHCAFHPSAAGEYRCVPRVPKASVVSGLFTNMACSRPMLQTAGTCASEPTLLDIGDACGPRVVRVTTFNIAYTAANGCTKSEADPPASTFGQLGDLAVTEMAHGAVEDGAEDLGASLKVQYVRGDDGAYGFFRLAPKGFATACTMSPGADGALHCLPTTTLAPSNASFTDSACTAPLFVNGTCSGASAAAVGRTVVPSVDACEPAAKPGDFYALGAGYSGKVYKANGTACEENGTAVGAPGARKLDLGADLGTATRMVAPVDGGLALVHALLPSGHRTTIGWFDPTHGSDCAMGIASDGQWRCLPVGTGSVRAMYADANCRKSKLGAYVAPTGVATCRFTVDVFGAPGRSCPSRCTLPATPKLASLDAASATCGVAPGPRRIFTIGGLAQGFAGASTFPGLPPTSCTPLTRPDEAVFDATEIPASDFVQATVSFP